jgi:predicted GH43/DUF377 family glycosyl hydrolase
MSVDDPFVFSFNGGFYMTYVGFDGIGYQTGLASSADLVNWKKEGCILHRDEKSAAIKYNVAMTWIVRDNALYGPGQLTRIGGKYVGAYTAYPGSGYEQGAGVIGLCRSTDLSHWQIEEPCLLPQSGAPWEQGGLYKICLVHDEGKLYLFYNAKNRTAQPWNEQTGVAISHDLKTWQRFSGNPTIANGPPESPDCRFASNPCVLKNGKVWAFYYFGLDNHGVARDLLATGPDLLHPQKSDQIMLDVGPPGSVDSAYAHKPSMFAHQSILYHFYCAVSKQDGKYTRGISVARSQPWS